MKSSTGIARPARRSATASRMPSWTALAYSLGTAAADDLPLEDEAGARLLAARRGAKRRRTGPCRRTGGRSLPCFSTVFVIASLYATCGLPTFASTLNSRRRRSRMISRCSSPMPAMIVCCVSSSVRIRNVGSSCARRVSAVAELILVGLASSARSPDEITGSGNAIDSSAIGDFSSHSVSPVRVSDKTDRRGDVARADRVDVLAMVGVHPQDPADALLAPAARVVDVAAFVEDARVDAEIRQVAVRIGRDLERQRAERLVVVGLARELVAGLRIACRRSAWLRAATACTRRRRRAAAARPCS